PRTREDEVLDAGEREEADRPAVRDERVEARAHRGRVEGVEDESRRDPGLGEPAPERAHDAVVPPVCRIGSDPDPDPDPDAGAGAGAGAGTRRGTGIHRDA